MYRYFKLHSSDRLPDPMGPLSLEIPSTSIVSANEEVRRVASAEPSKQRGPYAKFTTEQRAVIGKQATEHGITATIRYNAKQFPDLKESSVCTCMEECLHLGNEEEAKRRI